MGLINMGLVYGSSLWVLFMGFFFLNLWVYFSFRPKLFSTRRNFFSSKYLCNIFFSYHGCEKCDVKCIGKRKDEEKFAKLRSLGHLTIRRECEWRECLPNLRKFETPSFPKILHNYGTENEIIEGIISGELFGFIKCKIESPAEFIEKNSMINFPPIIKRMNIDLDMVSPYMMDVCQKRGTKFPVETVVQGYSAENHLLFTPLARFYLAKGLKISNIQYFIQYRRDRALKDFVSKITTMRKDADRDGKPTKGTTAKLCGNR